MQDESVIRFFLQVLAVLLGGGSVQLIIQLVRRRSELRKVNSESDSVVVAAANNQVLRLEAELERVSGELVAVRRELASEHASRNSQLAGMQVKHTESLAESQERANEMVEEFRRENAKLNRMVARLQLELSRANAEISILKNKENTV